MSIIIGDCLEVMKTFPDNHFTSVITDPPYGLHFMGKDWDSFAKGKNKVWDWKPGAASLSDAFHSARYDETRNDEFQEFMYLMAIEALRITKPGGHCLMFGAPRRYHRQTCALEDAGWEIRDCLMWLFGSGFPKSHNHFGIEGYGTALKPAYEPIIMAMKPCEGTFKQNAEKWGLGGINIDGCRIGTDELKDYSPGLHRGSLNDDGWKGREEVKKAPMGRWPSNLLLDEEAAEMLDEQSGELKSGAVNPITTPKKNEVYGSFSQANINPFTANSGGASRFFYTAKCSSTERNEGLNGIKNIHPTLKPIDLMQYLIKLVCPPTNAIILDPFAGSGSTIVAAKRLGIDAIGIEKDPEYAKIATARVNAAQVNVQYDMFS